jgi:hypothetical protein
MQHLCAVRACHGVVIATPNQGSDDERIAQQPKVVGVGS